MEWAAAKAGLIPENNEDALAMRMVVGNRLKLHLFHSTYEIKYDIKKH